MIIEGSISQLLRNAQASDKLRFGAPNQGRLVGQVRNAVGFAGWTEDTRRLSFASEDVEVVLARSTDLPLLVAAGVLDGCITGHDYVVEAGVEHELEEVLDLRYQATDICVVGRDTREPRGALGDITVVSQYPAIARSWLDAKHSAGEVPSATLIPIDGAAEMYVRSGLADVAIDAVMTGRSLKDNHMLVLEKLFSSTGRVYSGGRARLGARKQTLLHRLAASLSDGAA